MKLCSACGIEPRYKHLAKCYECYKEYSRRKSLERVQKNKTEGHECSHCGTFCYTSHSYCNPCQLKRSKWLIIDIDTALNIKEFLRRIPLKKFELTLLDIFLLMHYYECVSGFEINFNNKSSAWQINYMWRQLVKWNKQTNQKDTYKYKHKQKYYADRKAARRK